MTAAGLSERFEGAAAQTLRASVSCEGIGLHGGLPVRLTLHPAPAGTGILFRRIDLLSGEGGANQAQRLARLSVQASPAAVRGTTLGTVLGNASGVTVSTVEHLMAAFAGCGIDHAIVTLDGPEVPIMDGSAQPFLDLIEEVGTRSLPAPRRAWRIDAPVRVERGDAFVEVAPLADPARACCTLDVTVDYPDRSIGRQHLELSGIAAAFRGDLAAARTFCSLSDVEAMRANGLALGGSLDNAIVVDQGAILNDGGLRFESEFVRHKALDLIGDLHLLCRPVIGRITAYKPGHALNTALAAAIDASDGKTEVFLPGEAEEGLRILA
ncbi:UDP-3-O-acyl-N-acetylglucosamine deacetylase [Parvularcula oceani]|uniref:UDP-3-O-acyl-N-acetylglucosamine deacetylase n=1 Tax=Parvularcula oceani TaxID=1247963 RepID=UPI0006925B5F|nr:UDP-3-O-acyl-N-acetylglucosamine deacetylase [Parvularcula oceani]